MRIAGNTPSNVPATPDTKPASPPAQRPPAKLGASGFDPRALNGWQRFQGYGNGPYPGDGPNDPDNPYRHRPPPRPTVTLPEPEQSSVDPYQTVVGPNGQPLPIFDGTTDLGREVYQGNLGDCYLAASVSELAERRPDLIKDMIHDNGDGTVNVRFYHRQNGQLKPVEIRIDEKLPVDDNNGTEFLAYGSTHFVAGPTALWWPLIEKAYAKMLGGYDKLPMYPNDNAGTALEALTGRPATGFGFSSNPTQLAKDLQAKIASGKMVVVGTPNASWMENHGIVPFHVYSVYGAGVDKNGPYVLLRNPWGVFEPGDNSGNAGSARDGNDDGYFRISASEFQRYFVGGDSVDPPPPPAAPAAPVTPPRRNWHDMIE